MQFKKLLAVAAFSGAALGANNSTLTTATPHVAKSCSFKDFTASASGDIAAIAACPTAVGDITLKGDSFGSIELTGVEKIYGNFFVHNATQAVTLNAPDLQLVSDNFELSGNTILATLNLAQLTTVGTLNFNALPALEKTGLTAGITSAESIIISDTGLTSLDGINVFRLKDFNVNNNNDIETIDAGLQAVTNNLAISYNAEKVDVSLDQLTTAKNVYLQSINSLSVANLTKVSGSLNLISNSIDKIEIKELKTVGKSLSIQGNDDLEEMDFPQLTTIGGAFNIHDNEELESLDGFPKLKTIGGSANITGKFDNGSFESLHKISGAFYFESSGEVGCKEFKSLSVNGKSTCKASSSSKSLSSSSSKSKSSTSSEKSKSTGSSSSSSSSSSSNSKSLSASSIDHVATLITVFLGFIAVGFATMM